MADLILYRMNKPKYPPRMAVATIYLTRHSRKGGYNDVEREMRIDHHENIKAWIWGDGCR